MKNRIRTILYTVIFLVTSIQVTAQDFVFRGTIVDSVTNRPINEVHIYLNNSKENTSMSASTGNFSVKIEKLPAIIHFSHIAYEAQQIELVKQKFEKRNTYSLVLKLRPKVYDLKPINIIDNYYGQAIDTTPKIDFKQFQFLNPNFMLALVRKKKNQYLHLYKQDTLIAEQQVDKKFTHWGYHNNGQFALFSDYSRGSALTYFQEYQTFNITQNKFTLGKDTTQKIVIAKEDTSYSFYRLGPLNIQLNQYFWPRSLVIYSILENPSKEVRYENILYAASSGGVSVLYGDKYEYDKIEKDFYTWKQKNGKEYRKRIKALKHENDDTIFIEREYINSIYQDYFFDKVNYVINDGISINALNKSLSDTKKGKTLRFKPEPVDPNINDDIQRFYLKEAEIEPPILVKSNDRLYLMNFYNQTLICLDSLGRHIDTQKLNSPLFRSFLKGHNIITGGYNNPGKFYIISQDKGLTHIYFLDLNRGVPVKKYLIKKAPVSIYDISINGVYAYYLSNYNLIRTNLYKEQIIWEPVVLKNDQ